MIAINSMVRRWSIWILSGVLFAQIVWLLPTVINIRRTTPSISLSVERVEFKDVVVGNTASTRVLIRNSQSRSVRITEVRTSCGCTSAGVRNSSIPAFGVCELVIDIDGTASSQLGHVATVTVFTDSPDRRVIELPVYVTSLSGLVCVPDFIEYGSVFARDLPVERMLYVRNVGSAVCQVSSSVIADGQGLCVVPVESPSQVAESAFRIVVDKAVVSGHLKGIVRVLAIDDKGAVIATKDIRVTATILDDNSNGIERDVARGGRNVIGEHEDY